MNKFINNEAAYFERLQINKVILQRLRGDLYMRIPINLKEIFINCSTKPNETRIVFAISSQGRHSTPGKERILKTRLIVENSIGAVFQHRRGSGTLAKLVPSLAEISRCTANCTELGTSFLRSWEDPEWAERATASICVQGISLSDACQSGEGPSWLLVLLISFRPKQINIAWVSIKSRWPGNFSIRIW